MQPAEELLDLAAAAEEAGYDILSLPDSVFYPERVSADYPYTSDGKRMWKPHVQVPDPFVAISAMAAVTRRLRFSVNVLKLPIRNPLLTAKQIATLAVISGNRVGIGVGLSWIPEEFKFTDTDMRTRGARTGEAVEIIKAICAGRGPEWLEYHGKHYDFDRLMISPAPDRPVPIYIGGHSEPAFRRAARLGDGWVSVNTTVENLHEPLRRLAQLRDESSRGSEPFEIDVFPVNAGEVRHYRELGLAGATVCQVAPWAMYGKDFTSAERVASLRRFADDVISKY